MSLAELSVVQIIHESLSIGNAAPLQLVLSIDHGKWGKHELWRIHWNPQCICAH